MAALHSGANIRKIRQFLGFITEETNKAKIGIIKLKKDNPDWVSQRSGRPKKEGALRIALLLADEYWLATGKLPTVSNHEIQINSNVRGNRSYGNFLDLVEAVFSGLQINARPESMARQAEDMWKKLKSETDSTHKPIKKFKEKSRKKKAS